MNKPLKTDVPFADHSHLPSLEKIVEGFRIIDAAYLENLTYAEIKKLFFDNLPILPLFIKLGVRPLTTYRVRVLSEFEDMNKARTYSYPPKDCCKKTERTHLAGYPVLYTSLSIPCSLKEIKNLEPGQIIYISQWKHKKNSNPIYSELLYGEEINLGDNINDLNTSNLDKLEKVSESYPADKKSAFRYLSEKVSSYFLSNDYLRSSFIGHHILYDSNPIQEYSPNALIYPSVASGLNNINVAYHPDFVDKYLHMEWVYEAIFNGFDDAAAAFSLNRIGVNMDDGNIHWTFPTITKKRTKIKQTIIKSNDSLEYKVDDLLNEFYLREGKSYKLIDFIYYLLLNDTKEIIPLLINPNESIDFSKTYTKSLTLKINHPVPMYKIIQDQQHQITELIIELEYQFVAQSLENEDMLFHYELIKS